MKDITKIKGEFERIKSMGWILDRRPNNRDGGIGNTFEDLLGVDENNLKDPDFGLFEVKTQRQVTSSYITLFSRVPSYPKGVNKYLKDHYGEVRDNNFPELKKLYASLFGNRWSKVYEKQNMRLRVDQHKNKVFLEVANLDHNLLERNIYWDFEDLEQASKKLNDVWVIYAENRKKDEERYYKYNNSDIYLNFDFSKFISSIDNGEIMFDLRMGVHKSGKNYGKPHDHGSGFRIKGINMKNIYSSFINI
jgi:hypothetical protein